MDPPYLPAASSNIALSDWMSALPDHVKRKKLSQICIPGSHDSFTYSLDKKSPIGPDEPKTLKDLIKTCGPLARPAVYRWSVTQTADCQTQLTSGVRYFDFRLAPWRSRSQICVLHGLFGCKVQDAINEIARFLTLHKEEVVILDFQHNYGLTAGDRKFLSDFVKGTLGHLLCPVKASCPTLHDLIAADKRVIAVNPFLEDDEGLFWPRGLCPNPWPNTTSVGTLSSFLNRTLAARDANFLFVSQAILTPRTSTVAKHFLFGSLEKTLAKGCNDFVDKKWLNNFSRGKIKPNIVMIDFVQMRDLTMKIVMLNK